MVYGRLQELVVVHRRDAMVYEKRSEQPAVHRKRVRVYRKRPSPNTNVTITYQKVIQAGIKFGEENKKQFLCKSREILY